MVLQVHTDHVEITAVVDRFVRADPVRNTVLGTIGSTLTDSAWAAVGDGVLAVRSARAYPLVLAGDWTDDQRDELVPLVRELPALRGLSGLERDVAPVIAAVRDGRAVHRVGQRLFRLDELIAPTGVGGTSAIAEQAHRTVARTWFAAFFAEAEASVTDTDPIADAAVIGGRLVLWFNEQHEPVSMAARRPVIAGSARIGPVYTPPALRGHGYASAVTAAATQSVLDDGGVPVLFTDLANPTSNKIYQLLGYYPVEDRVVIDFGQVPGQRSSST